MPIQPCLRRRANPNHQRDDLYKALRKIEDLLLIVPWTERESRIYSLAAAAVNLYEGYEAMAEPEPDDKQGRRWSPMTSVDKTALI